ncbi:DUF4912 domain-containing protein [Anatilimnocola aggregata]|uniref:DUF4912 domain-containing protein n=1 Tax=Anatilimnocola aggregata TaxID=2528021 RepID=UPI001EE47967|nr:DUF4912 domain-containing protein [Anatilimnocola aggregata]
MITTASSLKSQSLKDLTRLAKKNGVTVGQSMRKDDLVKALLRKSKPKKAPPKAIAAKVSAAKPVAAKPVAAKAVSGKAVAAKSMPAKPAPKSIVAKPQGVSANRKSPGPKSPAPKAPPRPTNGKAHAAHSNGVHKPHSKAKPVATKREEKISQRIHEQQAFRERLKDLSTAYTKAGTIAKKGTDKDRLVLMVRDPYWLQVSWQVTRVSVKRAEAALAEQWHGARPILRLMEVDGGTTTSTAERVVREIDVHGGVTNWYIDVPNPPHSYRADLGYIATNGKFFSICRSNSVSTPPPDTSDAIDENWSDIAENYEKVYAMSGGYSEESSSGELQELFEERLQRPMTPPSSNQFGVGADRVINKHRDFRFNVDAEMIVFGATKPDARVTLAGEPVKLRPDGSFTIRLSMPDKRQVLPVVSSSADGVEQRTVVIAVERNTKVLEPMVREQND